ncbi:alpha/beta hydrolase [Cohnella sp. CIP 111063]|uniref:alpha/beta fold hydrolase n=1 Tax=unclassified Cohnella TaxID=2636738 RepID=UPI000B8C4D50|nr:MULTISPECIES: alpha/beta hydrolase [unclassified Cohnella]OXS57566.1 alpha/beta hydrolase [Cohnella sp. CIP 111063]PRX70944.1 pimeloyl-ACP methyl ester carboxylesterase [Cohnella sp. SGD-V74]
MALTNRTQRDIGFVFVHGAGLNGRIWERVADGLDYPCLFAEFPGRVGEEEMRRELTLKQYADTVVRQVKEWGVGRIVFVAHSLGGQVALQAAEELRDRLAGFVAVGAAIPKPGGSFLSALPWPKRTILSLMMKKMGTKPPESVIRAGLCKDLDPEDADSVVKGFVPESIRVYADRFDGSLPDVPRLYIRLEKDKEFGSSLQARMIRNFAPQRVRTLETGHLPMLGDPAGLRKLLLEFTSSVTS